MKIAVVLLIIITCVNSYFSAKFYLQTLITNNYICRERGLCEDKWYWADVVYLKYFGGNYNFYNWR